MQSYGEQQYIMQNLNDALWEPFDFIISFAFPQCNISIPQCNRMESSNIYEVELKMVHCGKEWEQFDFIILLFALIPTIQHFNHTVQPYGK